jgi:hypothetical protein
MPIKIALLHPSRSRPHLAFSIYNEWLDKAKNPKEIEYIMILDDDDPHIGYYKSGLDNIDQNKPGRLVFSVGETRNIVQAVNKAAVMISDTTELMLGVADDTGSMQDWDVLLFDVLKDVDNFKTPKYIGVSDGVHRYGAMLNLIVNRAWYIRVGHLLCPEYDGCCADDDTRETAIRLNSIVDAPHIMFEHRHPIVNKAPWDATYSRHNNPESNARNERIRNQRAARNFDIR